MVEFVETTTRQSRRRLLALAGLTLLIVVIAVFLGVANLPFSEILSVLTGKGSETANIIIEDIRIPRIITGFLAGIHFAVAGYLLQSVTRNPLADPTILGISQGATLAVTIFLFFAVYHVHNDTHTLYKLPVEWLPLVGSLGGGVTGFAVYLLSMRGGLGPLRLTLSGIAVGAVLHALAMGLIAGWGSARLEIVMQWLSGSLYARNWDHVVFLVPFTIIGLIGLPFLTRSIALLRFEEDVARSFGLAYRVHFSIILLIASGLAASAVGVVGPLYFVGLAVPHLARYLAGNMPGMALPFTILLGGTLVVAADLFGRLLGQATEIPVGVITAILGAPVLLVLLRRHV